MKTTIIIIFLLTALAASCAALDLDYRPVVSGKQIKITALVVENSRSRITHAGIDLNPEKWEKGFVITTGNTQAIIKALTTDKTSKTIAQPHLIATDGTTAVMEIGESVPIVFRDTYGRHLISYETRGIRFTVRPTLKEGNNISLDFTFEKSNIDKDAGYEFGGMKVPLISTRRISSSAEVKDGQTFIAGGSEERTYENTHNKGISGGFIGTSEKDKDMEFLLYITPTILEE